MVLLLIRSLKNIFGYKKKGYSFDFHGQPDFRECVHKGDELVFAGKVCNTGLRRGTVYVRIIVADPYDRTRIVFDSDRDLSENEKGRLRRERIPRWRTDGFACTWKIPLDMNPGVYYTRFELWTPSKLLASTSQIYPPYRFRCTNWYGWPEVVSSSKAHKPKVFISYSWYTSQHRKWVLKFADELTRADVFVVIDRYHFLPGDRLRETLRKDRGQFDFIIPVCSADYTQKANSPILSSGAETGVQIETEVFSEGAFFQASKDKFIPVTRDNPTRKLPNYLKQESFLYKDMDQPDWRGEPLHQIVRRIQYKQGS